MTCPRCHGVTDRVYPGRYSTGPKLMTEVEPLICTRCLGMWAELSNKNTWLIWLNKQLDQIKEA